MLPLLKHLAVAPTVSQRLNQLCFSVSMQAQCRQAGWRGALYEVPVTYKVTGTWTLFLIAYCMLPTAAHYRRGRAAMPTRV